jgi:hypothetical protein
MGIPKDYIFTSGTCAKKNFYGVITTALTSAGWTNIASNPATDGDVFASPGNTGDKALLLNLRKGNAASNANDVTGTDYCQMSARLPSSYTPGSNGGTGTFIRAASWFDLYIAPVAGGGILSRDTIYNYKIYTDKSKVIVSVEFPSATNLNPILHYIGLPDSLYCTETASRGLIVASTGDSWTASGNVAIADTPSGMGSAAAPYSMPVICTLAPKNPNNDGKYIVSDIYYGSATEGIRGKLDGVVAIPMSNIATGDTITIGDYKYYVLVCHSIGYNNFPSLALGVRTA